MKWILTLLGIPMGVLMVVSGLYWLATGELSPGQGLGASALGLVFIGAGINAWQPTALERLLTWQATRGSKSPFDDAEVDELIGHIERGDFGAAERFLERFRDGAWADRAYFVEAIGERCKVSAGARWCAARDSAVAHLVCGRLLIASAWAARGGSRAATVSDAGWRTFARDLERARVHLERAADADVADPTPPALLIKVAIGTDPELAEAYFLRALERDPHHHRAHELMLMALCQKWHGSHEDMFELARSAADAAPAGSSLPMLIVTAHIERWLFATHFDERPDEGRAWLASADHRAEVVQACADSIDHPDYRADRLTAWRLNEAAFWAYLVGDTAQLERRLALLGGVQTLIPWAYGGPRAYRAAVRAARG